MSQGRASPLAPASIPAAPPPAARSLPAGKLWDDKLSTASKVWEDQLKSATGKAEAALDAGISAASEAVRAGVSAAGRESEAVKSRLQRFYDTGLAHYQATEQQALKLMKQGVRFVRKEHPEASMATGVAAFFVLLPGPRRFLLRHTIGRFRSEEAMFKSAEQRYAGLKEKAEGHNGELQKLQASTAVTQVHAPCCLLSACAMCSLASGACRPLALRGLYFALGRCPGCCMACRSVARLPPTVACRLGLPVCGPLAGAAAAG